MQPDCLRFGSERGPDGDPNRAGPGQLADCREAGVDVVTLGQYLRPSREHLPVRDYVHPQAFETWRRVAEDELGFLYCASGPMVRSSYRAGELFVEALQRDGVSLEEARAAARKPGSSAGE